MQPFVVSISSLVAVERDHHRLCGKRLCDKGSRRGKDAGKNEVVLYRNNALHVVTLDEINQIPENQRRILPFLVGEYIIDMSKGQFRTVRLKAHICVHSTELAVAAAAAALMVEWHLNY
jgi:hypothetical protein